MNSLYLIRYLIHPVCSVLAVAPEDSCGTPLIVQTSNTSTVAPGNGPLTWLWDVRDESNNIVATSTDLIQVFIDEWFKHIDSVYVFH